ncbi:amine sulfotransferase [Tupaia chinensis]|uniref:amine sulfotransferase n=1 Tax=Tupaia chinensis TaxID=246437 RepID=UPI000FFC0974|nr:amine sulfotransferase [Tupaia chinensis]
MEKEGELLKFKGFYFQSSVVDYDILEKLEDFEIRDNDIFVISYPKSGTVWILQILCLIHFEGYRNKTDTRPLNLRAPFLEYNVSHVDLEKTPSPRIIGSHLPYYLVPRGLKNKKAKIIYMCRNPKDVMNSFFHFSNMLKVFQPTNTMEEFMKKFLEGKGNFLEF